MRKEEREHKIVMEMRRKKKKEDVMDNVLNVVLSDSD